MPPYGQCLIHGCSPPLHSRERKQSALGMDDSDGGGYDAMMVMTDDDEVVTMVVVVTMVMVRMVMGGADVDGGHADSDDGDNGNYGDGGADADGDRADSDDGGDGYGGAGDDGVMIMVGVMVMTMIVMA